MTVVFFTFNVDGGNGKLLYVINYESRSIDSFEITTDGERKPVSSVPIPGEVHDFWVLNDTFLVSYPYEDRGVRSIYKLADTTLSKYTECPSDLTVFDTSGLFAYNPSYSVDNILKIINLSNQKKISIEKGLILSFTNELIFFTNGNSVSYYDMLTDTCFSADYFIKAEKPEYGGRYLNDYCIQGFEEYPILHIYQLNEDYLLFNSYGKICKYSITTGKFEILFDYHAITGEYYLEMIDDNYFFGSNYGISNLVSLKEKKIVCQFIMNWIDTSGSIMDISLMGSYVTRESEYPSKEAVKTPNAEKKDEKKLGTENIPGEQIFPVLGRRSKRRLFKNSRQILKRFKAVLFGRLNKRVHAARAFSPVRALAEQPVFPA
jgi:hypothetical protein